MKETKVFEYNGVGISFLNGKNVMINATQMAKSFGKRVPEWTRLQSTKDFLDNFWTTRHGLNPVVQKMHYDIEQVDDKRLNHILKSFDSDLHLIVTTNGGQIQGTWMHEDVALEFARWLSPVFAIWCNDRIKELLKHGITATEERLEEMITNPDLIIRLATELKREREEKKVLELKNKHQEEVIEGLVYDIPVADMRQRINQMVLKDGSNDIRGKWMMLYDEFDRKYHMKVATRMANIGYAGTRMDYIDKELNMIAELYDLTCKLFESSYEQLMEAWGKYAKRARRYKS